MPYLGKQPAASALVVESGSIQSAEIEDGTIEDSDISSDFKGLLSGSAVVNASSVTAASISGSITSTGSFGSLSVADSVQGNLTLGGNLASAGELTIDAETDIVLDANGADIKLKDDGTEFGRISRVSSDLVIKSISNNNDILFKGVDASSTITALSLDMSEGGNAEFSGNVSGSLVSTASFGSVNATHLNGVFEGTLGSVANALISGSTVVNAPNISGSITSTGSFGSLVVADKVQGNLDLGGNITAAGDISTSGSIFAREFHTEFTSASVMFASGSNKFGDDSGDTHRFTGSMLVSGSITMADGDLTVTDNLDIEGDVDINGTTNLDNTDIDGTLTVDGGNIVFNEDSADQDFRVESNGNANMFFVDGGANAVGIGIGAPINESSGVLLHIADTGNSNAAHINLSGGDGAAGSQTGKITFSDPGDPDDGVAFISSNIEGGGANPGGNLNFFTSTDGGGSDNSVALRMTISGSGNVGIGTSSPDAKLKVEEDTHGANVQIKMRAQNDSGAGRTFAITADPDARSLTMGEVGEFVIKSDGSNDKVGIGNTTPSQVLTVEGTISGSVITSKGDITTDGIFKVDSAPDSDVIQFDQGGRKSAIKVYFASDSVGSRVITKVSDGGTDGGMVDALDVRPATISTFAGGSHASTAANAYADNLVIRGSNDGDGSGITIFSETDEFGTLYFGDGGTGNQAYRGYVQYSHAADTLQLGAAGGTKLFIGSGSVGFGTTEPGLVNGTDRTGGGDTGVLHLKGTVPRILFDDDGDTPQFAIAAQDFFSIDNIPDDSSSEGQLIRLNMSSDSPEIRTVVSASGTSYLTAPPIGAAGSENYTNYVMRRNRGTGINYEHNATSRDIRIIAGGNGVVLSGNGSSFSAISSDERKKQNWSNFVNASDKISTLTKIGQYQRLDPDTNDFPKGSDENGNQTILSGSEYGLSANEVQTILPHAVHTNKDGYLGLNYQDVFVLGIKAIQELTTEINTLKELSEKIELQQKQIEELKEGQNG